MASLLLAIVVGVWSFSFLGAENQEYPDFNNDTLWLVKEKKFPPPSPDFSTKEEALKIELAAVENEKGVESKEYTVSLYKMAVLYMAAGKWSDAEVYMQKLIEATKSTGAPAGLPKEYGQLAFAYFMHGQLQEAENAATSALDEAERAGLSSQPIVLTPLKVLGDIYSQKNELEKAADTYEKLYNIVEPRKAQTGYSNEFVYGAAWLGDIYRRQGKLEAAERYYKEAVNVAKSNGMIYPNKNLLTVKLLYGLGLVEAKEGKNKAAEDNFREILPVAKELSGQRSAMAGAIKKHLLDVLWKTNWISAIMTRMNDNPQNQNQNQNQNSEPDVDQSVKPIQN